MTWNHYIRWRRHDAHVWAWREDALARGQCLPLDMEWVRQALEVPPVKRLR